MKPQAAAACLALASATARAEEVLTLGDSLTFAYEAEFGFEITIQGLGTYGDGFGPEVKNWVEILSDPAYRAAHFDQGPRDTVTLPVSFFPPRSETLFLRRAFNWAIPGLRIDDLRRFLAGEVDLLDLLGESEEFSVLQTALNLSDFSTEDFDVADLAEQVRSEAERVVFFIGGNDVNSIYGTVYDGGSPGSFVADFIADAAFVLDWVLALNPSVETVVVSVPHIGITPDVKGGHPTDPVKTGRVTALLRDLNGQLAGLAAARGLGFADAFTATLPLLEAGPLCIHGVTFANSGSETGDLGFAWLNGELSYNFHPNTCVQALLADQIIDAFNRTYGTGVARLTATEMLGGLLGKSPAQIDLTFASWTAGFGLAGRPPGDDSDLDGVPVEMEFALGLDPTLWDADRVTAGLALGAGGADVLELAYPVRLPASAQFTLTPASATGLGAGAFAPLAPEAAPLPDGRRRALLPVGDGPGFLRLEATVAQ
jgi:hypothetical protein